MGMLLLRPLWDLSPLPGSLRHRFYTGFEMLNRLLDCKSIDKRLDEGHKLFMGHTIDIQIGKILMIHSVSLPLH